MEELYLMDSDSDMEIYPDVRVGKKWSLHDGHINSRAGLIFYEEFYEFIVYMMAGLLCS